jgi:uncharacterized protein YjbI with pentapeptide repeats
VPIGLVNSTLVVLIVTGVLAIAFLAAGCWLVLRGWLVLKEQPEERRKVAHDFGQALITGAIFGLGLFALQLYLDFNTQRVQEQRDQEARRETVQLAIATTSDLTGFDPRGEPLRRAYLAGKILDGARFANADLRHAELRDASLRGANLIGAKLQEASLINADLSNTVLSGANLNGAELRLAKFEDAALDGIKSLDGAVVDRRTCWPSYFFQPRYQKLRRSLDAEPVRGKGPSMVGHACRTGEHLSAGHSR